MVDNRNGSIIFEALFSGVLTLLALGCLLEVIRRSHFEVMLHHGAFIGARACTFNGQLLGQRQIAALYQSAFGPHKAKTILSQQTLECFQLGGAQLAKIHIRYPSWLRFQWRTGTKHHFEVTRKCRFPF